MKNAVFWDVAPCTSYTNRRFGGTYRLHHQGIKIRERGTSVSQSAATCSRWFLARGFFYPENGGDTFLRNVGSYKSYTTLHPRRWHSYRKVTGFLGRAIDPSLDRTTQHRRTQTYVYPCVQCNSNTQFQC
jgi:hypothetical protein